MTWEKDSSTGHVKREDMHVRKVISERQSYTRMPHINAGDGGGGERGGLLMFLPGIRLLLEKQMCCWRLQIGISSIIIMSHA